MKRISEFLKENYLMINLPKTLLTEVMISQKKTKTPGNAPSLIVKDGNQDKLVEDKESTRILGANLQRNMSWNAHLESGAKALFPAVRRQLGQLTYIGRHIPRKSRLNLATGIIVSRLNYLLPFWGGAANCYLIKAQTILNAAARWATGASKRTRISELMERTGWLSIREQTQVTTALQTWKLIHFGTPGRLLERITVNDDLTLSVSIPRLQFSQDCYRWRAAREWNSLPISLRETVSISAFKRNMKKHIRSLRGNRINMMRAPD